MNTFRKCNRHVLGASLIMLKITVLIGKRKGASQPSQGSPAPSQDQSNASGQRQPSKPVDHSLDVAPCFSAGSPRRQHSTGTAAREAEERGHPTGAIPDDDFLAAMKSLELDGSSPSNEADISVPLSNADIATQPATIRCMSSQFDPHVSNSDRPLDTSDTADAPSLSLALGPAHGHSQQASQTPARPCEACDTSDAPSLTLRVPASAQRSSTSTLYNQPSLTSNPRAPADSSDVLEAPSLRLPHVEVPMHQTFSMDAEFNAHFTFPANVNDNESSTTAALHQGDPLGGPPFADPGVFHELSPEFPLFHASQSPVHAAAQEGDKELLQKLLKLVPDLDALWCDNGTPLHSAVQGGSCECVGALLAAGAAIDCVNGDGITPLMLAAVMGHEDIMLLLLENDADICKAFLPGSSEGLLHFCVEHVRSWKAVWLILATTCTDSLVLCVCCMLAAALCTLFAV